MIIILRSDFWDIVVHKLVKVKYHNNVYQKVNEEEAIL